MVPKTELRYDYEYAKRLYRGNQDFEGVWRQIIDQVGVFEEFYEKNINYILELIPRYTGFSWEEYSDNFIPIFLVDSLPSFSHPLTLSINENLGMMLIELIHELAHCNMYCGFKSRELQEESLNLVTRAVIRDLDLDLKEEIEELERNNESESKIISQKTGWDLNKKTIKEFIRK